MDGLNNILGQFTSGNVDPQSVANAASQHVSDMDPGQLSDHLQTAASNAQQAGQGDIASQIQAIVGQLQSNPDGAKAAVIDLVRNNPQIVQHFAPEFLQGIAGKLGASG